MSDVDEVPADPQFDDVDELLAVPIGIFAGADDIPSEGWTKDHEYDPEAVQEVVDLLCEHATLLVVNDGCEKCAACGRSFA